MVGNNKQDIRGKHDSLVWLFVLLIATLVTILFQFQGNTADVRLFGRSVFGWMVARWGDATVSVGTYSHGWLIPIVSLVAVWFKRRQLMAVEKKIFWKGLWVIAFALVLHLAGVRAQQPRISLLAFVLLLWAVPLFLQGVGVARLILFPCAYLLFCIPLNFLDELSFYLRMISAVVSVGLLNGVGIASERVGSAIYSTAGGGFSLDVADPCSGIRSLLAITALAAAYAHFSQKVPWKKWVLFFASVPLAVIGNIVRIVTIGVVAHFYGQNAAVGFYHDYSGYIVLVIVVMLLIGLGDLLERKRRRVDQMPGGK